MQVEFVESGGFAGISKKFILNENDLDDEKKKKFEELTQAALTDLPESGKSEGSADMMSYEINFGGKTVSLDDGKLNNALRALYTFIKTEVMLLKKAAVKK